MEQICSFLKDQRGMVHLENAIWISLLILIFIAIGALTFKELQQLVQKANLDR